MNAARRLMAVTLAVLVGGLVLGSSVASATPPETPLVVGVEDVTGTSATFRGS